MGLVEDRTRFWAEDITVHEWAHAIENLGFDDETRTKCRKETKPIPAHKQIQQQSPPKPGGDFHPDREGQRDLHCPRGPTSSRITPQERT